MRKITTKTRSNASKFMVRRIFWRTFVFEERDSLKRFYARVNTIWDVLPPRIKRIPKRRSKVWSPPKKCSSKQGTPVYLWYDGLYVIALCSRKDWLYEYYCQRGWNEIMGEDWKSYNLPGSPKKFWWR